MEDVESWTTIFQSCDNFYLWARMSNDVEIVCHYIREIASVIDQQGLRRPTQEISLPIF